MNLPLVFALWGLALCHAQNLTLTFTRDNQRLDLRCSINTTGQGQISEVASLTLVRVTSHGDEVIATSSRLPADHDHALGATVTTGFSPDVTSETFVNLRWVTPTNALDGAYRCELDAFDAHNAHLEVKVNKTLRLTDTDPALTLTPESVKVGLSRSMALNCSVDNPSALGMAKVFSIELRAVRQGQGVSLATATLNKKNQIFPGSEDATVTSQLDSHGNYLSMTWQHPQASLTGRYLCDVNGLSSNYLPVNYVRYVDVVVQQPDVTELVAEIHAWQRQYDVLVARFRSALEDVDAANASLDFCQRSRTLPRHCGQVTLDPGRYPVTLATEDGSKYTAVCQVERPGRVWTVFQRRFDGSVSFDRNLTDYEVGFGNASGEFWLGFDKIRALLGDKPTSLRITLKDKNGHSSTMNYAGFEIGEGPEYPLHLDTKGSYRQTHGLVEYGAGLNFSTPDSGPRSDCANSYGGGWWLASSCGLNNLNGRNHTSNGFVWLDRLGSSSASNNLHESEMMFLSS